MQASNAYGRAVDLRQGALALKIHSSPTSQASRRAVTLLINELASLGKTLLHSGQLQEGSTVFSKAVRLAHRESVGWGSLAAVHYLWGRSLELYGGHGQQTEEAASSNFTTAMQISLGKAHSSFINLAALQI